MDEINLLAALCGSRDNYESVMRIGLESNDFGEAGRIVVESAGEQYRRDQDLQKVDLSVLRTQVERRYGKGSMATSVMDFVAGFPNDISGINLIEEYRLLRLGRASTSLATLLATGQHGAATQELIAKYSALVSGETGPAFQHRLTVEDFEEDETARIKISPSNLNTYIGGGVLRGHNITVYGRPDSGKSLFALNTAAYACMQGRKVLYVANEEPAQDITRRLLARLSGVSVNRLRDTATLKAALERSEEDYANWYLLHRAGCTARDIATQAAKVNPDFVIVDQLKNLSCKHDNRALQLDTLARQVREIGIEYNCVTMSITQAGDSAHNKLVLQMNDIEWSNTGIPGAADLMIGVGVDQEFEATDKRMLSVPKNKVNGQHGAFPCWIDPQHTAFLSKKRVSNG
jgi:KaiC/GvpD/RAD55 family RecA-like ATPase